MQDIPASCNKNDTDMKDIRKRRESTSIRDAEVHSLYKKILEELGDLSSVVSRTYIYEKIREKTRLSIRTISFIINHTNVP